MGIVGAILSNLQSILDGLVVIVIVAVFSKYHKTIGTRFKQSKARTITGFCLVIIGFISLIFATVTYHPINLSTPVAEYGSYYWSTMGALTLFDLIGIILIAVGGLLINKEATLKIAHRIAERIS